MTNKVIQVRDVIFNEDEVFDDNLDKMRDDCLHIELDELAQLLISLDTSLKSEKINSESNDCMLTDNFEDLDKSLYKLEADENQNLDLLVQQADDLMKQCFSDKIIQSYLDQPYSTLPQSLSVALLAATIQGSEDSKSRNTFHLLDSKSQVWKAAFNVGQMSQQVGKLNDQILD